MFCCCCCFFQRNFYFPILASTTSLPPFLVLYQHMIESSFNVPLSSIYHHLHTSPMSLIQYSRSFLPIFHMSLTTIVPSFLFLFFFFLFFFLSILDLSPFVIPRLHPSLTNISSHSPTYQNPQPSPIAHYLISHLHPFLTNTLQWGAADAEIKVPSGENTELKCSPFKAWSRSVYSHTCYAYCQEFLPHLFLPFRSIQLHFFKTSPIFFPVLAVAITGSCVGPQNKISHPVGCRFPC